MLAATHHGSIFIDASVPDTVREGDVQIDARGWFRSKECAQGGERLLDITIVHLHAEAETFRACVLQHRTEDGKVIGHDVLPDTQCREGMIERKGVHVEEPP